MSRTLDSRYVFSEDPLSSAAMRFVLFPKSFADKESEPRVARPFGLCKTESYPLPERSIVTYCHRQQVTVDDAGRPLVASLDDADPPKPPPKPKKWESKTYSDGDEGQEESSWGWEEQA